MRFLALSPLAAAGLLAAVAIAVVTLYFLKPPPRRVVVPSHLLWLRVLRERKRRSDALRWWLSLVVALAIGLGLGLALTRPEVERLAGRVRRLAVVVDNGPTMATRCHDGRTRFDHALDWARRLLQEGSAGSEFLVADTAGQIRSGAFAERAAAREALARLTLSADARVRFPRLDLSDSPQWEDAELYFISDGVLLDEWPVEARVLSVFEPAANAGITAFETRPQPADPSRYEASVELVSHFAEPREVSLRLSGPGRHRLERSLRLSPGQVSAETLDLSGFASGPLRASLVAPGDALELDDVAFSHLPGSTRVVLVSPGSPFLENALRSDRSVELTVLTPAEWDGKTPADVLVFDRFAPEAVPPSPGLVFGPPPSAWFPGVEPELVGRDHPLLENVALEDLRVVAGTAPRIAVCESPRRYVLVGFDLANSNLPLLTGFAIFLSNALGWLGGSQPPLLRELGSVELPGSVNAVTGLDGTEWPTVRSGARSWFEAASPGLYTASLGALGERRIRLAVNLSSPRVSQVSRSRFAGQDSPALPGEAPRGGPEPWILLLGVSVILLLLEWWTFHRRLTV